MRSGRAGAALVDVDTQNQFAWLALADAMRGAGRESEGDAALERASLAPAWHEHIVDVGRLLSRVSPASGDLDEQAMVLVADLGNLYGSVLPVHGAQTLGRFCKASDHRAACGRILATMTRDSDAIFNLRLAAAFAARAGIDRSVADGYQARADAVSAAIEIAPLPGDFALLDDGAKRTYLSAMRALLERGEVQFWRDKLIAAHLDERTAAARHVASLSAAELQRRADRSQPTR